METMVTNNNNKDDHDDDDCSQYQGQSLCFFYVNYSYENTGLANRHQVCGSARQLPPDRLA